MKTLAFNRRLVARCVGLMIVMLALSTRQSAAQTNTPAAEPFAFIAAGDMRSFVSHAPAGKRYFDGLCEAVSHVGGGAFMISPGDCDPPAPIRAAIDEFLGTNYLWYPVIGNHDAEAAADMAWMRHWAEAGIPHLSRPGPAGDELTTYSFDVGNSHFVVLNEYENGKPGAPGKGDVADAAMKWLDQDLAATRQPLIWVIGHKPVQSLPDMDSGRARHDGDSVSADPAHTARFLQILNRYHVRAYICGHTHNCSIAKVQGVWQADSGHARGAGDTGSPSTFLKFRVTGTNAWVDVYRSDKNGVEYGLKKTVALD